MDLTRRRFHALSAAASLGSALPAAAAPTRTKLVLLGTAEGPTPKPNRAAPSTAAVVEGQTYLVDAGNGTARQMTLAGLAGSGAAPLRRGDHRRSGLA